jgi:hypothetical protein
MVTTAQLKEKAEHCRRLARGKNDALTTHLLAALAEIFAAEANEQVAEESLR